MKGTKADVVFFRDYLTAARRPRAQRPVGAQSKDEIAKVAPSKGFESVTAFNPRLGLEGALGSVYDELAK